MGVDFRVAEAVDFDVADLWRGAEEVFQAEPRVLGGQVTARNQHGRSSRHTQPPCEQELASSSPSLSGRVGVKRFQTVSVDLMWDVTRRVLASLRDRHLGPPMMGSGGCGGPICRRVLAVRLTAGIKDSKRTRLIHRPCGDIAPPVGGIQVFSCCSLLLCTTRCEFPVMRPQLLLWSSETRCHPPTCDA